MPSPKWKQVFKHNGTTLSTAVGKKKDKRLKCVAPSGNAYIISEGNVDADVAKVPTKDSASIMEALGQYLSK